ncbi:MAG: hypothetical protein GVY31_14615 [Alphaproteobacteria bacterium]|jgi:hypothetical protein|nr:hypothetical protein [Alphaproteobacteria bacterium]
MFTILADSLFTASRRSSETSVKPKPEADRFISAHWRKSASVRGLRVTHQNDLR